MLLSVVIYVIAVTAMLAGAAWISERAAMGRDVPTRFIWSSVIAAAIVFLGVTMSRSQPPVVGVLPEPGVTSLMEVEAAGEVEVTVGRSSTPLTLTLPRRADSWLLPTWLLMSGTLLLLAGCAHFRLVMERSRWLAATVDGRRVLVSANRGPAVVGVVRPEVVVPRWLLDMPETERGLMLRHEDEHRAAGDSRLMAAAVAALVVLPWNVPLWWVVARLRVAMEIDCDRRVLKGGSDVRPYASLLIDIGARAAPARLGAVAFSSSFSFLERRIKAMTDKHPRYAPRTVTLGALAGLLIVGACYVERVEVTISDEVIVADTNAERLDLLVAEVRALEDRIRESEALREPA